MSAAAKSNAPDEALLKPIWMELLGPPWLVSLVVLVLLAAVRFFAILSPFELQELYFLQTVAMWALPFLLLTREGRRQIGLTDRGMSPASMTLSAGAGATCGLLFFALGMAIFGNTPDNWCISLRNYLHFDEMRGLLSPLELFAVYSLPAIFLNPVGEEILFRGLILQAFTERFNSRVALVVNSSLFALVYLSLHGIWHDAAGYHLRVVSAAVATVLMTGVGAVFTLCRTRSGTLWTAMAAHAAFNLTLLAATIHQFIR